MLDETTMGRRRNLTEFRNLVLRPHSDFFCLFVLFFVLPTAFHFTLFVVCTTVFDFLSDFPLTLILSILGTQKFCFVCFFVCFEIAAFLKTKPQRPESFSLEQLATVG